MAKNRVTRKKLLKEPDEFLTTAGKLIRWARENTRSLIVGACIFFGVVFFISFYSFFQQNRANAAETLLGQALAKYQTEIEAKDPSAALAATRSDFEALLASYGDRSAGRLGTVIFGHICLAGQAYEDAIAQYQKSLSYFGDDSSLYNVILNGLGTAYQQKGEYPRAVAYFKQLAAGSSAVLKDAALFNLGRLYGQLGQTEESRKVYQQLSTEFPQSMYANVVKEKVGDT
jgi:tetratricopeptide (TPR) repeat protein